MANSFDDIIRQVLAARSGVQQAGDVVQFPGQDYGEQDEQPKFSGYWQFAPMHRNQFYDKENLKKWFLQPPGTVAND